MVIRFWSKDEIETLRRMWADKKTASQIAKVIGRPRDGVIGQAHRLNLESRPSPIIRKSKAVEIVKKREESFAGNGHNFHDGRGKHNKSKKSVKLKKINNTAYGKSTTLDNLKQNQCHWPITERPGVIFCAAKTERGSYCEQHRSIAYQKENQS